MGVTEPSAVASAPSLDTPTVGRRERFLAALERRPVDRTPVICTGGSMSSVPAQVVALSGQSLPAAHRDAQAMAQLALAAARLTGFEAVGVPLCTTVEAEAYGAPIDLGDADTEARIVREPYASVRDVVLPEVRALYARSRAPLVVEAVRELSASAGDLPIIANLIGPMSIAASLVDPMTFMRELRTRPDEVAALAAHVTDFLIDWAHELIAAVAPHLRRLAAAIKADGGRVLLHMCGTPGKSLVTLATLGIDAFIPDASVVPAELRASLGEVAIIGNVSTFLLHQGRPESIGALAERLCKQAQIDVLAPTCGMSSATPLINIRALTQAATAFLVGDAKFEESMDHV
jgi:[methyl-Co(III) methanol-specific corrinoid protein]:coenzyme M methyltransferase